MPYQVCIESRKVHLAMFSKTVYIKYIKLYFNKRTLCSDYTLCIVNYNKHPKGTSSFKYNKRQQKEDFYTKD